jgi:HAD superfamily hydrolase (TIGR01509 family)
VLFDLDGTLVDTWNLYIEAYRHALEPHFGRRLSLPELAARKPAAEIRFLADAVGMEALAACHAAFVKHYTRLHADLCEGLYPGVEALLGGLRARGARLGVVTGKSRPAWEVTAAHLALGPFDVVVTEEDVPAPKPDPAGLLRAANHLGVAPADTVYVGDSLADLGAAHAAGMSFAAVLWCKAPGEREDFHRTATEQGVWLCPETPQALLAALAPRRSAGAGAG